MGKTKEILKSQDVVDVRQRLIDKVHMKLEELPMFQLYHLLIVIKRMEEE